MSVLADHHRDDGDKPARLRSVPRSADPVPLADAIAEYVAELLAVAPPLDPDLRAQLAGLLNSE